MTYCIILFVFGPLLLLLERYLENKNSRESQERWEKYNQERRIEKLEEELARVKRQEEINDLRYGPYRYDIDTEEEAAERERSIEARLLAHREEEEFGIHREAEYESNEETERGINEAPKGFLSDEEAEQFAKVREEEDRMRSVSYWL